MHIVLDSKEEPACRGGMERREMRAQEGECWGPVANGERQPNQVEKSLQEAGEQRGEEDEEKPSLSQGCVPRRSISMMLF